MLHAIKREYGCEADNWKRLLRGGGKALSWPAAWPLGARRDGCSASINALNYAMRGLRGRGFTNDKDLLDGVMCGRGQIEDFQGSYAGSTKART